MSATIEIEKLANYFRQVINGQILPAYQFHVGDRLFDVQEMYLEHIQNYGLVKFRFHLTKKKHFFCLVTRFKIK